MTRNPVGPGRYPLVDALRGASIVLVVLLHLQIRVPLEHGLLFRNAPTVVWSFFCRSGSDGVRMFFVISGFLITLTALRRWQRLNDLDARRFYQLRFARIAPLLLVVLLVLGVLHHLQVPGFMIDPAKTTYWRALASALTLHLNWLEGKVGYLPPAWDVLWSLSVEEAFYLLFPIGCLLFRWKGAGQALLVLIVLAGPTMRAIDQTPIWGSKSYLACMDSIAIGCLAAQLTHRRTFSRRTCTLLALVGAGLSLAMIALDRRHLAVVGIDKSLLSLGVAALLVSEVRASVRQSGARWLAPLRAYGRLSYEIYLTHVFVVLGSVALYQRLGWTRAHVELLIAIVLAASWALGAAVERVISAPCNRWLRARGHDERRGFIHHGAPSVIIEPPIVSRREK
jgi:peptidoglycan/LPS O-acetylase OafA/YrhL